MSSAPTVLVVLVVVHHDGRYLIVEERDGSWYLPAGRVDPGEDLVTAAARETLEEAGVLVEPVGLLGFDHEWYEPAKRARLRFVFVAEARGDRTPKSSADHHSRGAAWLTKDELRARPLRHPEVLAWIERRERGGPLLPRSAYETYGTRPGPEVL